MRPPKPRIHDPAVLKLSNLPQMRLCGNFGYIEAVPCIESGNATEGTYGKERVFIADRIDGRSRSATRAR